MSKQLLDQLARGVGQRPGYFKDEAYLTGYFQRFRPNGDGLERTLQGIDKSDELCERISAIFKAAARDFHPADAYFVIKAPPSLSADWQLELLRAHLDAMNEIAEHVGNEEVPDLLAKTQLVSVADLNLSQITEGDDTELAIYEMITDELIAPARSAVPEAQHVMREAFYTIAAEPYLACYAQWPWFRDAVGLEDPFQPYFELWKNGIQMRFADDQHLHFCQLRA